MGQPPRWKQYGGAYYSFEGAAQNAGGGAYFGLYKDLLPSIVGIGLSGEGYAGGSSDGSAGGFRAQADLRGLMLKTGLDYNVRTRSADWILSFNAPFRRAGLFGHGSLLRVDWIPSRGGAWQVGVLLPLERHMGRTRPRDTEVDLPRPPPLPDVTPAEAALDDALGQVRIAARWIFPLTHVFWEDSREDRTKSLERTRREIAEFKVLIGTRDARRPQGVTLAGEVGRLHGEMARAFGLAVGVPSLGIRLHDLARSAMAEEVVLPYNRLHGQWKRRDSLLSFGVKARARFLADVQRVEIPRARTDAVARVFDGYLHALDDSRAAWSGGLGYDSRLVFLPLQLVLQPWEHDTQAKIDALIGRASGTSFTRGNRADYITGRQFQAELLRSIHEAEDYHVLWLHDYPGRNAAGDVDRVGFSQAVDGYLSALTERVRAFDGTRRLPVYLVFLDEKYYAQRDGRLFMDVLEDPLGKRMKLPAGNGELQQRADLAQDSLRRAVSESEALQGEARQRGQSWLRHFVKVHVSIMNPMDFSYRTSRLVSHLPIAPDTIIRDHRKIAFRDITEADPGRGEALYPGVAVSEQYATTIWEDRAIRATGPALLSLKEDTRRYLVQNGFREADIPPPLRSQPLVPDYDDQVARLEATGANVTAVQVHNDRGFAPKNASLVNSMLYTLMPAGSLIVVPSSMWTDPVWAGQLVGAALRGCHVYVIAPASDNAPQGGFVAIARSREVFTRFFEIQKQLEPEIEAAGGRLRSGLYTRRTASDEMDAWLGEVLEGYRRYPSLADEFPLAPAFFRSLLDDPPARTPAGLADPSEGGREGGQRFHRKTQLLATRASLQALTGIVATHRGLDAPFFRAARGESLMPEERAGLAAEEAWLGDEMIQAHRLLPDEVRAQSIYYLTVGSLNIDTRGHVLDGEDLYVLAGESSLAAYTDFAALLGSTTWLDSQEELDRLLPPVTHLKRRISRWVRKSV